MGAWGMRGWMRKRARNPIGTAAGVAALLLVVSAGSAAGAATGAAAGPGSARPWGISTLAGGVGGPGPASQIAGGDCAVAFRGGSLYATGFTPSVIRRISMRTGQLDHGRRIGLLRPSVARRHARHQGQPFLLLRGDDRRPRGPVLH